MFPLENEADIRRHYTNVLKQALYLQSGSSRAGMTLAKENQNRLWQALKSSEYQSICVGHTAVALCLRRPLPPQLHSMFDMRSSCLRGEGGCGNMFARRSTQMRVFSCGCFRIGLSAVEGARG